MFMSDCFDYSSIESLCGRWRGTLQVVLVVNAVMFLVIAEGTLYEGSTVLLAVSLDNLSDALT